LNISYSILTHNETDVLEDLLEFLGANKKEQDEIVVLDDYSRDKTLGILTEYKEKYGVTWEQRALNKNFADQKNYLNSLCSGDFIFNLDADERPPKFLFENLHVFLEQNPDVDAYWVPRINTVKDITDSHIKKWGWSVNDERWINWPDWQLRIYRNVEWIKWFRPVHETVTGFKNFSHFPEDERFAIRHNKVIENQEKQNDFYRDIVRG